MEKEQKFDIKGCIIMVVIIAFGFFIYKACNSKPEGEHYNISYEDSIKIQQQSDSVVAAIREQYEIKIDSAKVKELKQYFRVKKDDFESIEFIIPKSAPVYLNQNGIYLYFGIDEREQLNSLRIRIQYAASAWLFINIIKFAIDGETFTLSPYEVKREVVDGGIVEWIDEPISKESIMLNSLRIAKSAKMRFEGKHFSSDKIISQKQIKDIDRALSLYEAYGGK